MDLRKAFLVSSNNSGTNNGSKAEPISLSSILIHGPETGPNDEFVSTRLKSLIPSTSPLSMSGMSTVVTLWPTAKVTVPLRAT